MTALGSGYELSRRDMEMRGFGTIFGADQSGTCDVGLDLQANILETAARRLNKECILSISDTRICIGCELELFGVENIGILPSKNDLSGVSRWEAALAENLIIGYSPKKTSKKRSNLYDENTVLRNYLASGTSAASNSLRSVWTDQLTNVRTRVIYFDVTNNCFLKLVYYYYSHFYSIDLSFYLSYLPPIYLLFIYFIFYL